MEVDTHFLELLGRPVESASMSLQGWLAFVDPRDRPALKQKLASLRALGDAAPLATETRLTHSAGTCRWFHLHADWVLENGRGPAVLSGVNVEIGELKAAGEALDWCGLSKNSARRMPARTSSWRCWRMSCATRWRRSARPPNCCACPGSTRRGFTKTGEIIARQVGHLNQSRGRSVDVSRLTRGLIKLQQRQLDMRGVVHEAAEQVQPLLQARRHALSLNLAPGEFRVVGDRKRLVQIVINLLNNAARYTPEGGRIEVRTEVAQAQLVLCVIDNGIGMEPALAARVFEAFAQAEQTPDRSSGGLGPRLALVRSLVKLHGGTVHCESAGLHQGSRFTVRLPLARGDAPEAAGPAPDGARGAPNRLRVMVVDDNVDAALMLAMFLESAGHQVAVEHRAGQALARARVEAPDVMLLDIGLPEMDGYELARRLRAQPETAAARLIAITGYGQERDRNEALAAGFSLPLVKPVDPGRLLALLAQIQGAGGAGAA